MDKRETAEDSKIQLLILVRGIVKKTLKMKQHEDIDTGLN